MARYLLDTTALIDFSKGREPAKSRLLAMVEAGDELGICAINIAEFYAGIDRGTAPAMDEFIDALLYWDTTATTALTAALQRRRALAQHGRGISTTDALIAAVTLQEDAIVVTENVKDYRQLGLRRILSFTEDEQGQAA
jgi:predicted nucleic acid-binding protein